MKLLSVAFTFCEGHYDLGAGALLNSLSAAGFSGDFIVFYRTSPPRWLCNSEGVLVDFKTVGEILVYAKELSCPRHFGYQKAFEALSLFSNPSYEAIYYFDPDIVALAPWNFFEAWAAQGVALCLDSHILDVANSHPWREEWRSLLEGSGKIVNPAFRSAYHNSGFFGVRREHSEFLENWMTLTLAYEDAGGDTSKFYQHERYRAFTGDQDFLAASLMATKAPVSTIGLEGMGFNGFYFILAHAIETPKPWARRFTLAALRGRPPSAAAKKWFLFTSGLVTVLSPVRYWITKIDLAIASIISRFWKR